MPRLPNEVLSNGSVAGRSFGCDRSGTPSLKDNPLQKLGNVIMTVHSAYYLEQSSVTMKKGHGASKAEPKKGDLQFLSVNLEVKEKYQK